MGAWEPPRCSLGHGARADTGKQRWGRVSICRRNSAGAQALHSWPSGRWYGVESGSASGRGLSANSKTELMEKPLDLATDCRQHSSLFRNKKM